MEIRIYNAILTPEEEGGYGVEVPALPGCFTCGDDYEDAVMMAADAMKTVVASMAGHGEELPASQFVAADCPEGCASVLVAVEVDASYIVEGDVVSAAEASRMLGVTPGRVTHMIDAGKLDGYRRGRRTFVTTQSIEARKAESPKAGRPKRRDMVEA